MPRIWSGLNWNPWVWRVTADMIEQVNRIAYSCDLEEVTMKSAGLVKKRREFQKNDMQKMHKFQSMQNQECSINSESGVQ